MTNIEPDPDTPSHNQHKDLDSIILQNNIYAVNDHKVNQLLGPNAGYPETLIEHIPSDLLVHKGGKEKKNYYGVFNNIKNNIKADNFLNAAKKFSKKLHKKFNGENKNRTQYSFSIIDSEKKLEKKYQVTNEKINNSLYKFKHTIKQIK